MNDQIKVTFAQVQATQEQAQMTAAGINSALQDLKSYLAPMVATWEGSAAQNYNAEQARWDRAAGDLNAVLAAIGQALGSANDGFQLTESQNAARFA